MVSTTGMIRTERNAVCLMSVILCSVSAIIVSCAGAGAGKQTRGTTNVFDADQATVQSAVTNAFAGGRYNDMLLSRAAGHDYLERGWHPTNGFLLQPGPGSPYQGYFHIVITPTVSNRTAVTVRTVKAEALAGKEPGVHGGWAFHFRRISPIPKEETNVLSAVQAQLQSSHLR